MSERFQSLPSDAEERWLAGQGPEPVPPSDRLAERAGVLVPRAGGPSWSVPARRDRLLVEDGALVFRRGGRVRRLAGPGEVRRLVWLAPGALPPGQRWLPAGLGHVLLEAPAPVVLRVDDWVPGELVGRASDALRAAGVEGLARDLGVPLEVVSTPGALDLPSWRAAVRPWRGKAWATACIASFGAGIAAAVVLLARGLPGAATVAALVLFLMPAVLDHVALRGTRRRAWAAAVATPRVATGAAGAIALHRTPHGTEIVLAERRGWQGWMAGPDLGGVSSLVVARAADDAVPWGVLVLDRDERVLAALPAAGWLPDGGSAALSSALAAPDGLQVSTAVVEPWPADRLHDGHARGRARLENDYVAGGRLSLVGAAIGLVAAADGRAWVAVAAFAAQAAVALGLVVAAGRAQ